MLNNVWTGSAAGKVGDGSALNGIRGRYTASGTIAVLELFVMPAPREGIQGLDIWSVLCNSQVHLRLLLHLWETLVDPESRQLPWSRRPAGQAGMPGPAAFSQSVSSASSRRSSGSLSNSRETFAPADPIACITTAGLAGLCVA